MILYNENKRTLTLQTRRTTYQMKADAQDVLLHTYYGPKVEDDDLSYLIHFADRGFSANPRQVGHCRTYSLDTLPQEYSTCGVGDMRLTSAEAEQADGSLLLDLRYAGHEIRPGKYALEGLPAFHGADWDTLSVLLRDPSSGVEIELLYGVCEEHDLITRSVIVSNQGEKDIFLRKVMSVCLDFCRGDLDLITFDGGHTRERNLNRAPLRQGEQGVGSVRGTSSHQHNPFVILCEHGTGEDSGLCYGAALLYSGGFDAKAELCQFEDTRFVMGLQPHGFRWKLAPGQRFTAPEAALICSPDGFTPMTHRFHRAIRECLIRDPRPGQRRPVLINNWEATEFIFDAEQLFSIAAEASKLGLELFVMDDGWFGKRDDDTSGLGDWVVNTKKLPGGLEAFVPRIKELGMQFGIWVEPEMVNVDSELYRSHPDWALGAPGRPQSFGRSQLVLDFSREDVRNYIYDSIRKVLDSADISYIKWDMNRSLTDVWSAALPADRQGEVYHRYVLGLYDFLERLHRDYPDLFIEGCSGGGGRFDAGMLYYTPQIWCSDNTDAIDRLKIQYGTSFCYPVSANGSHVSAVPNAQTGRCTPIETRGVAAMSGTFGYEMDLNTCTEAEKAVVKWQTEMFKERWQVIQEGDYYRLTDPFRNLDYTAWQHVSRDKSEALVSLVTCSTRSAQPFIRLKLKGLDPARKYSVNGSERLFGGDALMYAGYTFPMFSGDYQSVQLYLKAEEQTL